MDTLTEFNRKLDREFQGRIRCRFVTALDEYHIEQRVGARVEPPFRINSDDHDAVRARDGYGHLMVVRKGDRMRCPECNSEIKVPVMHFGEAVCEFCRVRGKDGRWAAAHYPLGDALIQHIRRLDPLLGHNRELLQLQDAQNNAILAGHRNKAMNEIESITLDDYRRIVGIPTSFMNGKRFEG